MPNLRGRYIVETDWLAEHLDAPDLVVLDGSTHLPTSGRNAFAEYQDEHIPGSDHRILYRIRRAHHFSIRIDIGW